MPRISNPYGSLVRPQSPGSDKAADQAKRKFSELVDNVMSSRLSPGMKLIQLISKILFENIHASNRGQTVQVPRGHDEGPKAGAEADQLDRARIESAGESRPQKHLRLGSRSGQAKEVEFKAKNVTTSLKINPLYVPSLSHFHHLSSWGDEESLQETRRKICLNLKENLDGIRVTNHHSVLICRLLVCLFDCHLKPS